MLHLLPTVFIAGTLSGLAGVKWPVLLAGGILAFLSCLLAPEVLGFFTGGGLYLVGRTFDMGHEALLFLNVGVFLFPMFFLMIYLFYKKRACALIAIFRLWEFWAVLGLGLLMLVRLPDSLFEEYGVQKIKYYLVNNMVCFFGPVLSSAVWGNPGLYRFLKGVLLGGLALTVYFWVSGSYLELPFNIYAVLNFNPIEISRLIGLFILLVVIGEVMAIPHLFVFLLAAAASAAMILLDARGPALALVIALLCGGMAAGRREFRLPPVLVVPLFILLAVYVSSHYWFSPDFFSLSDNGRWQLYQAALATFGQNPVLGAGTGSYASISPVPGINYPHNLFLESAAELGLAGLALSLLFVFAPLLRLACWRKKVKETALAVSLLVFCLVNAMLSGDVPGNYLLWLAGGVAASAAMTAAEDYR
ncbi:MAG: O-Antigen ligase [Pelotomaculum sp. PtaB.Bin117]|nr:MAG: O-Antigen ligase [Pelotomaculum sp. PtaB.Bin117]